MPTDAANSTIPYRDGMTLLGAIAGGIAGIVTGEAWIALLFAAGGWYVGYVPGVLHRPVRLSTLAILGVIVGVGAVLIARQQTALEKPTAPVPEIVARTNPGHFEMPQSPDDVPALILPSNPLTGETTKQPIPLAVLPESATPGVSDSESESANASALERGEARLLTDGADEPDISPEAVMRSRAEAEWHPIRRAAALEDWDRVIELSTRYMAQIPAAYWPTDLERVVSNARNALRAAEAAQDNDRRLPVEARVMLDEIRTASERGDWLLAYNRVERFREHFPGHEDKALEVTQEILRKRAQERREAEQRAEEERARAQQASTEQAAEAAAHTEPEPEPEPEPEALLTAWEINSDVLREGRLGMKLAPTIGFANLQGEEMRIVCEVRTQQNQRIRDLDRKLRTPAGGVGAMLTFTPDERLDLHRPVVFIPYEQFHLRPGRYDLRIHIWAERADGSAALFHTTRDVTVTVP